MRALLALLALLAALGVAAPAAAGSFALIGDVPYSAHEVEALRHLLADIGNDESIAFVVHDGDIKSGGEPCDDARFAARREDFDNSIHPLVLVPGDNEWTDCHRDSNGRYDPLERLEMLRRLFFADDSSLGRRRMTLTRQGTLQPRFARYRENARWEFDDVVFVAVNLPGSNNNWKSRGDNREFHERLAANTAWIAAAFERARSARLAGVVLVVQANPSFERDWTGTRPGSRDGYLEFRRQVAREALAFARPVLLVHGDTHFHRIDQPLRDESGKTVANVTRVETFGSPGLGWVKVTLDRRDERLFRFEARRHVPMPR